MGPAGGIDLTSGALLASAVELHSFASISHAILDYLGTLAFAMSAALVAVEKKFDIVGLAVLAMVTAIGGGVLRDVIIGQHPPAAFTGFSHIGIALAAAGLVFLWQPRQAHRVAVASHRCTWAGGLLCHRHCHRRPQRAGRAVGRATRGHDRDRRRCDPRPTLRETPMLLRPDSELYAVPAMLGASITALLIHVGLYTDLTGLAAALAAFGLRMLAMRFHWHAPQARRRA